MALMAAIQRSRIAGHLLAHDGGKRNVSGAEPQMEAVGNGSPGGCPDAGGRRDRFQSRKEVGVVGVLHEDRTTVVSSRHCVVKDVGSVKSAASGYAAHRISRGTSPHRVSARMSPVSPLIGSEEVNWAPLAAAATLISLPAIPLTVITQRHIVAGLAFGALTCATERRSVKTERR